MNDNIVTRFAPSPTGTSGMHIGNLRTALYSYLHARKHGGKFILRIEDTDKARSNSAAVNDIHSILNKFNLKWDAEYTQSTRLSIYQYYAYKLLSQGDAYICTCSDNEDFKECRCNHLNPTTNFCIRLNINNINNPRIICADELRGLVIYPTKDLYNIVLLKSDGYPTYHLASVVDDHLMKVTDIFRGDEWLGSFPYHHILYHLFKWDLPRFYHLPLITNTKGEKLSKRDGDFSVQHLLNGMLLPSGITNYIALLGWHPVGDKEVMTLDEMVSEFDASRLKKSACQFDEKKLRYFNLVHGRTDYGYKEFKLYFPSLDPLLIDRFYEVFKLGTDTRALLYKLHNHKEVMQVDDNTRKHKFLVDTLNYLSSLPLSNHAGELLSEEEIDTLLEIRLAEGYSKKETNEWIREALIEETVGMPAKTLLGLDYIISIKHRIGRYVL